VRWLATWLYDRRLILDGGRNFATRRYVRKVSVVGTERQTTVLLLRTELRLELKSHPLSAIQVWADIAVGLREMRWLDIVHSVIWTKYSVKGESVRPYVYVCSIFDTTKTKLTKLRGLISPHANYTDRAAAAGRRS